jgi:hypothetical protein
MHGKVCAVACRALKGEKGEKVGRRSSQAMSRVRHLTENRGG